MPKPEDGPYKNRVELLQGTLDMLILQTLQWGSRHGYGIIQALRSQSGEVLRVETGSLYPALHRMERHGWITSKWGETDQKQRAKFWRITAEGKKQLAHDRSKWEAMVGAIGNILSPSSEH